MVVDYWQHIFTVQCIAADVSQCMWQTHCTAYDSDVAVTLHTTHIHPLSRRTRAPPSIGCLLRLYMSNENDEHSFSLLIFWCQTVSCHPYKYVYLSAVSGFLHVVKIFWQNSVHPLTWEVKDFQGPFWGFFKNLSTTAKRFPNLLISVRRECHRSQLVVGTQSVNFQKFISFVVCCFAFQSQIQNTM